MLSVRKCLFFVFTCIPHIFLLMELAKSLNSLFEFSHRYAYSGNKRFEFTPTLFDFNFLHAISNDFTCFDKIKIFAIKKLVGENHIPGM